MRYILCCQLNQSINQYQKEIAQQIANKFGLQAPFSLIMPAHIVLKYDFELNEQQLPLIKAILTNIQQQCKASLLSLRNIKYASSQSIYQQVILSESALQLYFNLRDQLKAIKSIEWYAFENPQPYFNCKLVEGCVTQRIFEILNHVKPRIKYLEVALDNIILLSTASYNTTSPKWEPIFSCELTKT